MAGASPALQAGWDEFADTLENRLAWVSADGERSLQFSGRLDLTTYYIPETVADLRYTAPETELLFSPVLQLFADARLAPGIQAHAQLRADRGFDPADEPLEAPWRTPPSAWRPGPTTASACKSAVSPPYSAAGPAAATPGTTPSSPPRSPKKI